MVDQTRKDQHPMTEAEETLAWFLYEAEHGTVQVMK